MQAKKALGQNFLMHRQTAERIVEAAGIESDDVVLEIGPGTGMLTRELLKKAQKVVAIEADSELIQSLQEQFEIEIREGKLEVTHQDIRSFSSETLKKSYKIVANIPYYITGELFRQFLTAKNKPISLTFLVQKEVAERIARSKKESLLSLSIKAFGEPKYCFTVPKGAFLPAPKVDSAVLSVQNIHSPFNSDKEESRFFEILHAGFGHKRKMLAKNLESVTDPERIKTTFDLLSLSPKIRAEDVILDNWLQLAKAL
jgi:16S rRNA (adenine1518-N6/adenine1519-N6)-dimethyltransferase